MTYIISKLTSFKKMSMNFFFSKDGHGVNEVSQRLGPEAE